MVYVHTILRDVAGLFKVGRLVAYTACTNQVQQGAKHLVQIRVMGLVRRRTLARDGTARIHTAQPHHGGEGRFVEATFNAEAHN